MSEADLANALREKYYDAYVTISEIQNRIVVVKDNLFTPRKYSLELKKLVDLCKNFEEYCINSIKRIEEKLDHERTADAINEFLSIADEPLEVIPIQPAEEKTDILILSEMEFTAIKETHKAPGKQKTSKAKESAPKKPPAKGKATKQVEFKKDKAVKTPDSSDASRSKDGKK
ncbi:MAG: hypothetical protein LBE27_08620 [Deltaproteobacteria bacterium]|nr:hypothetical protein [Deltaproteobacteria bacterium]